MLLGTSGYETEWSPTVTGLKVGIFVCLLCWVMGLVPMFIACDDWILPEAHAMLVKMSQTSCFLNLLTEQDLKVVISMETSARAIGKSTVWNLVISSSLSKRPRKWATATAPLDTLCDIGLREHHGAFMFKSWIGSEHEHSPKWCRRMQYVPMWFYFVRCILPMISHFVQDTSILMF